MRSTTSGTRCAACADRRWPRVLHWRQPAGPSNQKAGKSNAGQSLEIGFHPFLRRLRRLHCPIVSAVNGPPPAPG